MSTALVFAGVFLAQAALPAASASAVTDSADVAYTELSQGRSDDAISRILANDAYRANDPAALINLGTAYARMGRLSEARDCFDRAIASRERYDLELANGQWMDSRRAARAARELLERKETLALATRNKS